MSRTKNHELIMHCIYIKLTYMHLNYDIDINNIMQNIFQNNIENIDNFSKNIVRKTIEHINDIIPILEKHLVNWKWERILRISQAILLMSYTHYKYVEAINKAIIIDIAVKLAKKYLDNNEYKFINGILDKVL